MFSWIRLTWVLAVALLVLGLTIIHVKAHSWYDPVCCSGQDCAPVDRSELVQPTIHAGLFPGLPQVATLWVETKHGRAMVPPTMIPRESKDERVHACIRAGKVICIFMPPTN